MKADLDARRGRWHMATTASKGGPHQAHPRAACRALGENGGRPFRGRARLAGEPSPEARRGDRRVVELGEVRGEGASSSSRPASQASRAAERRGDRPAGGGRRPVAASDAELGRSGGNRSRSSYVSPVSETRRGIIIRAAVRGGVPCASLTRRRVLAMIKEGVGRMVYGG